MCLLMRFYCTVTKIFCVTCKQPSPQLVNYYTFGIVYRDFPGLKNKNNNLIMIETFKRVSDVLMQSIQFFFNTGHPLFQGVSHDLSCCPIVLLPARVLWAIHCRLAQSNQCLCNPPQVNHMRADYWKRLLEQLLVELGSRVYDVNIVIEPIYSGCVPFCPVGVCQQQLSVSRLRDWKNLSKCRSFPSVKILMQIHFIAPEKKFPWRGSNRGPLGRNITKRTVFH